MPCHVCSTKFCFFLYNYLPSAIPQDPSALMYQTFTIEHNGECVDMVATHEKEAAKLFGLYLWHKGALNWLEEGNKPVIIHVRNTLISSTFSLWRDKEKIYTEATFYKKVTSSFIFSTSLVLDHISMQDSNGAFVLFISPNIISLGAKLEF